MLKLLFRKWGILPTISTPLKKPSNFPYYLLRIENLFILLISLYLYFWVMKGGWILFIIFMLLPDVTLLGYALGIKVGGISYDLSHTYLVPILLFMVAFLFDLEVLLLPALVWQAHIAQDRARGFGLRYLTHFEGTHLHSI